VFAGVSRRKFITTTVKGDGRQAPDLVERNFAAAAPDRLWVADITYVPTWAGFLYLAVVLDAFSRRIVGWSMATTLATQLVLDALNMALMTRRPRGVIHHSDQGSQAGSNGRRNTLKEGVAMTRRRRRSDRSGRRPLFSPGRPVAAERWRSNAPGCGPSISPAVL
jgi:transposase InsO family protein